MTSSGVFIADSKTEENHKWSWSALNLLIVFWSLSSFIMILSGFYQKEFFNPEIEIPFLIIISISEFIYALFLINFEKLKYNEPLWWILFLLNGILITILMISVHWNQSMFFLMYLINIVASGLVLKSRGSYLVGLISLVGFNFVVLVSPQAKLISYIFSLVINNLSLIIVSFLSGQLIDYLETLGLRLNVAVRDLRKMKNLHELILGNIPSGVVTVDQQGELVHCNPKGWQILTDSEIENHPAWHRFNLILQESQKNSFGQIEFNWNVSNTEKKIVKCQSVKVSFEESSESVCIYVLEDVTDVRGLEEILKNQEKLAAIGKLAAGIAHEIRNPLASISGSVQMLSVQAGSEDDKKLFNIVIKETDRLNLLISEFLDYAKPLPKPTERISLTGVISEVLELVSYNKKLRSDILIERLWDEDFFILGYKDKLKQAFLNIVINAFQAMDKVQNPSLFIKIERENSLVVLKIRDSGSGMKEETRRRIFEPFYTTKSQGTGLGLAVTHKIFEGHNASIIVESEEGKGTEFVIKIKEAVKLI